MSKAATADSYSKNMLHQKVFRTIICILFCIIALSVHTPDRELEKPDDQAERYADPFAESDH